MSDSADGEQAALRELYAAPPDAFLATRTELVGRLNAAGEQAAGQRVQKLRKPTIAAWIVNALVLDDADVTDRLARLAAALRTAQDELDAERLRELSGERRTLVAALCAQAFQRAGRSDPPAALADDVRATFDAAIADGDVAARLGQLQHAERWSGFGFATSGQPQLTLVRGGRDATKRDATTRDATKRDATTRNDPASPTASTPTAAQLRRSRQALETARRGFAEADAGVEHAQADLDDAQRQVGRIEQEIDRLRKELDTAKTRITTTRSALRSTKQDRQRARRELDRAERKADG